jgi:hypothetical protein
MPELLTTTEQRALEVTAELTNLLNSIIGDGPTREQDLSEMCLHVHYIQHAIMAQAAARAYPDLYRKLGEPARADA